MPAWPRWCRSLPASERATSLLVVGALADVVEDQFRRLFDGDGHRPGCSSCRRGARPNCRRSGRDTRFLLAQPFLADTARALEARGATRIAAPFPLGAEGTTRWLRAAADALAGRTSERSAMPPRSARHARERALARYRAELAGKRVFLFPDSQLEVPLARFLSRELACSWSRSARPICIASIWPKNLRCCRRDIALSEGQDVERQLDRCRAARPDLVVCGLGLANPLEAEGMTTKWSIELLFTPIQGYDQAADLAELFARPLVPPRAAGGLSARDAAHALDL